MFWLFLLCSITLPAVWGDTGSFTEAVEGQISVITSHGAVQQVHSEVKQQHVNNEYSAADLAMMRADIEGASDNSTDAGEGGARRKRHAGRVKRFMSIKASRRWPKAIVPYDFTTAELQLVSDADKDEIHAAYTLWHKYTCVRFVPWVEGDTMEKYGLPDEGHVTHSDGDSCSSSQGNYHNRNGQWCSCCSRWTCIHELGHTMGLWHEHQNYQRADFMRVDWERVPADKIWTYKARPPSEVINFEYDAANNMHYGGPFSTLYEDLKPVIRMSNQFYMFKDVALSHDCKALHCSDFSVECHNEGFVSLIDDQCSCLCPPGLDPDTGCTTTVKSVTPVSTWPAGAYAMFSPKEGCPGADVFQEGAWQHWSQGGSKQSPQVSVAGDFTAEYFIYQFCVKPAAEPAAEPTDEPANVWQPGRYCILRAGGECPAGFQTGYVQFDDSPDKVNEGSGQMPDGVFGNDTRLEFCCRDDGFHIAPLTNVPNTEPLVLFPNKDNRGNCQGIAGMRWSKETLDFHNFPDTFDKGGAYPYGYPAVRMELLYCFYVPVTYDCGGEITLSSSNREVVITSPNFPSPYDVNTECNWFIKTENNDSKILLNFDKLELTSKGGDCQDSLEIRYNLAGQPGVRYCGDGLSRTLRSLNDIVLLTLRSDQHQVDSDYGFRLTASLHDPEEEECYAPETKGTLYRGTRSYTRGMKACLPWSQVPECHHHAFSTSDLGEGLDSNYCRNPDDTAMPWCYTSVDSCQRDYCDVCNIERSFNIDPLCNNETVCIKSESDIIADHCMGTCGVGSEVAPPNREQTCGSPPTLSDGEVQENPQDSYTVGQTVTYKCSSGSETVVSTCLSEGQWSPIGYVCGACSPGWDYNGEACYKVFEVALNMVSWYEAIDACRQLGADLASINSAEEQEFVSSLRTLEFIAWIGANDQHEEGSFLWANGEPTVYTNWDTDQPNDKKRKEDCVVMAAKYNGARWDDRECDKKLPMFICKSTLSERTVCRDRSDCPAMLETSPFLCSQHPVFAKHQCARSCGICPSDSPPCSLTGVPSSLEVVSPTGQDSVALGEVVTLACAEGLVLTRGQLSSACGLHGQTVGGWPVCEDPATLVVESGGDVRLVAQPSLGGTKYAYVGMGSQLTVQRPGLVKQWKYYSTQPGWTVFQIWRPDPEAGPFKFRLVGQTQVMTQGKGQEIYDIPQTDWIDVLPGDRVGLWEGSSPLSRGSVGYSTCSTRDLHGMVRATLSNYRADYSTHVATAFSDTVNCMRFSFKAVIYPVTVAPENADVASNHVSLLSRGSLGKTLSVYIGDSENYRIPQDGFLSQWQFYLDHPGTAALQVWRARPDLGENRFQLVGQNKYTLTDTTAGVHTLLVPQGERIAVKEGDSIGIWYSQDALGIRFQNCNPEIYPESASVRKASNVGEEALTPWAVREIPITTYKSACQMLPLRAIISQEPERLTCSTEPESADVEIEEPAGETTVPWGASVLYRCKGRLTLTGGQSLRKCDQDGTLDGESPVCQEPETLIQESNDNALIARANYGSKKYSFMGVGSKMVIHRHGVVKQWKFYSSQPGWSVFQIWRNDPEAGPNSFVLVGQTQVMTKGQGEETYDIPESDWISVQPDDRLAEWEGDSPVVRGKVPFDSCGTGQTSAEYGVRRGPLSSRADFSTHVASAFSEAVSCVLFSYKAVIYPVTVAPENADVASNHISLLSRNSLGTTLAVYIGDSQNYRIPHDGFLSQWQFYLDHPGTAALQVWRARPDLGENRFQLVGQNKYTLTDTTAGVHTLLVPQRERIAVKEGDSIGIWYSQDGLGIRFQNCNPEIYPESASVRKASNVGEETLTPWAVREIPITTYKKACQMLPLRAIISQEPDRPTCSTELESADVEIEEPAGETTVPWGASVLYRCKGRLTLTGGQLSRKCEQDGTLDGEPPVCQDPDTLIQESNDNALIARAKYGSNKYSFMGVGSKMVIHRHGVVKQWKFYSSQPGWSVFQIWRNDPEAGPNGFVLVGQTQVMTKGQGEETYDIPESDWISVQPDDRLAEWEGDSPVVRGKVPFDSCGTGQTSAEYGVRRGPLSYRADFSTHVASAFSEAVSCVLFSYKAVIYPVTVASENADVASNHVSLLSRGSLGKTLAVYTGDSENYRIPQDGFLSQWQFYLDHPGTAALQVWRARPDLGENRFQLVGQNKYTFADTTAGVHTKLVPQGERIAVKEGDSIGIWYSQDRLGIRFQNCNPEIYPESASVRKASNVGEETLTPWAVREIPSTTGCLLFPLRAIISQEPERPTCSTEPESADVEIEEPAGETTVPWGASVLYRCKEGLQLTRGQLSRKCEQDGQLDGDNPVCQDPGTLVQESNDIALVAREKYANSRYSYMGVGSKMVIHRHGVIKQWKFYSSQPGWSVFQIWRNDPAAGPNGFVLVGQTQVMTKGQGEETYDIPESDWISVQPDDRLAEWEGYSPIVRGNVPFDNCVTGQTSADYGVRRGPKNYRADFSTQAASLFSTSILCRIFSYKAVIYPLDSVPVGIDTASNQAPLFVRGSLGDAKKVYLGDSANFDIPSDGFVKQWQFFVKKGSGQAALQVWRPQPDLGEDIFSFVGQTMLDMTTTVSDVHKVDLTGAERFAVQAGDVTGIWYAGQRLGIRFDSCDSATYPEGGQQRTSLTPLDAAMLEVGQVVNMPLAVSKTCYKTSFRAIVSLN